MQWQPISECDLDCFENLDVVSFLFKVKTDVEMLTYEYEYGLFSQKTWFSIGRTLEYLKKQGATHFMIYEFPEGE